ncbi:MAG: hypothetical protein MZV49_01715 [Rhodopseudomonas palustris]|nr:hypothetical protein [Rhodopseudomonas palustris]
MRHAARRQRWHHSGVHIDLSVLLGGRRDLSALMVGQGAAAAAQVETAVLGVVRKSRR